MNEHNAINHPPFPVRLVPMPTNLKLEGTVTLAKGRQHFSHYHSRVQWLLMVVMVKTQLKLISFC